MNVWAARLVKSIPDLLVAVGGVAGGGYFGLVEAGDWGVVVESGVGVAAVFPAGNFGERL